jgi:hypothetical protein
MIIEELYDGIVYYKNTIENPNSFIKEIEDLDQYCSPYKNLSKWEDWYASTDQTNQYGYSKNGIFSFMSANDEIDFKILKIVSSVNHIIKFSITNYCTKYGLQQPWLPDYFSIKKYMPGADMGPHVDSSDPTDVYHPVLSGVIYLNDDYEGGEIEFPNQNINIKPESGSLIIFPSVDPYVHHPKKIISGNKYMIPLFWYKEAF